MSNPISPEQIDALLPQTQCGLCGYAGCMPYAQALAQGETTIDLCPPGGVKVLKALAELLQQDAQPFVPAMEKKAKPKLMARIREDECIGCTKCIQACPVDAILGAAKQMHSIITDECTGCELCVAPCPVDCIDIFAIEPASLSEEQHKADQARQRFQSREKRLQEEKVKEKLSHPAVNLSHQSQVEKAQFIEEALQRVKSKKN